MLWSYENTFCAHTEEKKLLNKVIIFVFFVHKKYSCSFITLQLNHWCHMDYFNDVLIAFLGLECVSCIAVYGGSESSRIHKKYLNLCSKDERRSYGVWNDMRVSNCVNYPFKDYESNFYKPKYDQNMTWNHTERYQQCTTRFCREIRFKNDCLFIFIYIYRPVFKHYC